jgi:hypothetical protein
MQDRSDAIDAVAMIIILRLRLTERTEVSPSILGIQQAHTTEKTYVPLYM